MSGVRVWRGIRFGEIEHRFAAPEVVSLGERPAPGGVFGAAPWQTPFEGFDLGAECADDCLFLNVWAPEGTQERPVLLWFYGGGFEGGAASAAVFDGAALAEAADCVVVTANYRLGFIGFGHLAHHGGRLAAANNLGVRDAIAALEWVQAHITLFGGDPQRITVAGQSAGGFLCSAVVVAPGVAPVAGLALYSGGASRLIDRETAEQLGDALLDRLGLTGDPEGVIEIPGERIVAVQADLVPRDLGIRNGATPRALGVVLDAGSPHPVVPIHPMTAVEQGRLADTAILSSATLDEGAGFPVEIVAAADGAAVDAELRSFAAGADVESVVDAYATRVPDAQDRRRRVLTDYVYRLSAARIVRAQHAAGGRAVLVDFPRDGGDPSPHGADVPAIFARTDAPRDLALCELQIRLIAADPSLGLPSDGVVPALAPAAYPEDVMPPATLLDLWDGAVRP